MKKTALIAAAIAILCAAAGYYIGRKSGTDITAAIPREEPPAAASAERIPVEPSSEPVTYITRSDVSAASDGAWSETGAFEGDVTGDGAPDTLKIYTSAESADGEILWDDGQNWVAEVSDSDGGYYTLLSQYISNGNVYAEVSENKDGEKTITLIVTGGAGLSVKRYGYSSSGFKESVVFAEGASNVLYSSVPWYN